MTEPIDTAQVPSRRRWIVMGVALAAVALLVGGAAVVNAVLPGKQPVRAGEQIILDQSKGYRPSLILAADGWAYDLETTQGAHDEVRLVRGPLELKAMSVTFVGNTTADADSLWKGLGDIARTENSGVRLGEPEPITSDQGVEGLTGPVHGGGHEGVAVLYPSPDGQSATQLILKARERSTDLEDAVDTVSTSVVFTKGEGA